MKIAVYHNLSKGGAFNLLINVIKILNLNNTIDFYCHNQISKKIQFNNIYIFKLNKPKNIFGQLIQTLFELKKVNIKIAQKINKGKYDLVLVFQCQITQSPYLLKYLNNKIKTLYFLNEPKREFYETTSFDHYSFKRTLARILRLPIKYIDKNNCKYSKTIISNSEYSKNIILKTYDKKSIAIYPGVEFVKPKKITKVNHKNFVSIGILLKIKGHIFSIDQLSTIHPKITIIGRASPEDKYIINYSNNRKVNINLVQTENNHQKELNLKAHTFYLANNEREPFGITTLEATAHKLFVFGKNEGGTGEIIRNGINGLLYPNDIEIARKYINIFLDIKYINYYKTCRINWPYYVNNINKIINAPNE